VDTKVVLITGASAGFGKACAEHLAGLGHRVYGTSRRARFPGTDAPSASPTMIPMDVTDEASVRAAVDFVSERAGRIDVLINNAGIGLAGAVEDTTVEEAKALFDTNLFGMHRVCRAVLPMMRSQGAGLVINISSIGGLITIPFQGFYSASKYAVESMSDALRLELAPFGINVCLVEPGDFKTDFTAARVFAAAGRDGSPYAQRCRRAVEVMEHDERNGSDPRELARLVVKIIRARRPKPRYLVGKRLQKLGAMLKRVLSARSIDRIMVSIYMP
jgi:NAD(P)-dependent dehydrogenase (short-subunit alcohol dehydrogenase family)